MFTSFETVSVPPGATVKGPSRKPPDQFTTPLFLTTSGASTVPLVQVMVPRISSRSSGSSLVSLAVTRVRLLTVVLSSTVTVTERLMVAVSAGPGGPPSGDQLASWLQSPLAGLVQT